MSTVRLSVETDSTGRIQRRKVTSQAFKGEGTPLGIEATWVVGEPVVRAIAILERLQPPRRTWLFANPPSSQHHKRTHGSAVKTTQATNNDLGYLCEWIAEHCAQHGRGDAVPLVSGRRFRLCTSQFRRTLAWFIASQPGGAIAGAIQYRHISVQIFEGYAGTSKSGFRAEAEQEMILARGDALAMMVERHEHQQLRGPSASEARDRLEAFGERIRFVGRTPDRHQMTKLMQRHDPRVYPGKYITCNDVPDRRLCRLPGQGEKSPDLGGCKPLTCRNVTLTAENAEAWRGRVEELDRELGRGDALAPLRRAHLQLKRDETTQFLTRCGVAAEPAEGRA